MRRKLAKEVFGCLDVGISRFFWRVKKAKMFFFTLNTNTREPSARFFVPSYASIAGFVFSGVYVILTVLALVGFPKIFPAVVVPISVYMVYQVLWPSSCDNEPNKAVSEVLDTLVSYIAIAIHARSPRRFSKLSIIVSSPRVVAAFPYQLPSFRVVFKKVSSLLKRKFFGHEYSSRENIRLPLIYIYVKGAVNP